MFRVSRLTAGLFAALLVASAIAADNAGNESILVGSYNVENWLSMDRYVDGKSTPGSPKPERERAAVVDVIASHKPDIVGLVEIGSKDDLEDLRSRLKNAGLDYPNFEWLDGPDPDRHVALLSRFPIVERNSQANIPIELDGKPEVVQRGFLDVTVEPAEGYRLRLIGVHFKSRREVPEFDQAALRARESEALRAYVDKILESDPDTNLLLYGDFNDTKNEYPIEHLLGGARDKRLRDLYLNDSLGDRWTHFWKTADIYSRIDYLIASPGLFNEVDRDGGGVDRSDNWFVASDHRMIYAKIQAADK